MAAGVPLRAGGCRMEPRAKEKAMQNLIGWSEVSAALVFSFGFGLLLECLLLKYLMHVVAHQTQLQEPEARDLESALPVARR